MKTLKLMLAIGGGVAIGVAAGILLAPEKGSETRRRIVQLLRDRKNLLKNELQEFLQSKGINISDEELSEIFQKHEERSCECEE